MYQLLNGCIELRLLPVLRGRLFFTIVGLQCILLLEKWMAECIKFPIGVTEFEEIRRNGYYYVDKTFAIPRILNNGAKSILFTRPRRFEKTTFQTMLRAFFDLREDNKDIFSGLAVMNEAGMIENWMNRYPVVFMTFKDIDGLTFDSALSKLSGKLVELFQSYAFLAGLLSGAGYVVKLNREMGTGGADIMLLNKKNRRAAVFEIKRTESSDSMRNIAEEALLQIREKEYGKDLEGYRTILFYGVAFCRKNALFCN